MIKRTIQIMKLIHYYIFQKTANTILMLMYYAEENTKTMQQLFTIGLIWETTAYYYGYELK